VFTLTTIGNDQQQTGRCQITGSDK